MMAMHESVMAGSYTFVDDPDADDLASALLAYQERAHSSDRMDALADRCDWRAAGLGMARDLATAYRSLAELARWRAAQLRGECS